MKNTRQVDLDHLEEAGAKKTIERVHKQTKDPYLEKLRRDLMEAHKRNNLGLIERLEKLVVEYERKRNL